jgi:hypothetical protein
MKKFSVFHLYKTGSLICLDLLNSFVVKHGAKKFATMMKKNNPKSDYIILRIY